MSATVTVPLALLLAASAPAPRPATPTPPPPSSAKSDGTAVHVAIDTIVIDRHGTWTAGSDEADLVPGATGVLRKAVTLNGKDAARTREAITLEARLTPAVPDAGGPDCLLAVGMVVRRGPTPLDKTAETVSLRAGQERLIDAYVSPATGGRVALRVRCEPAKAPEDAALAMVTFDVSVERRAEGEQPEIVGDTRLVAAIGREAGMTVADHVTLPDGEGGSPRFRDEDLEIALAPGMVVAGRLQVEMTLTGRVSTMARDGQPAIHPVEHQETWLVTPRESRTYELVLPGDASAEGWSDLHYRIDVRARF